MHSPPSQGRRRLRPCHQTVCSLEAQDLYDSRVESACETAELARALFDPACRIRLRHR